MTEKGGSEVCLPHIIIIMTAYTKLLFHLHICMIGSYLMQFGLSFIQYLEIIPLSVGLISLNSANFWDLKVTIL